MNYRCCVCCKLKPAKGFLWFQSWMRFVFCEPCWGRGNSRSFPGAMTLARKLIAIGAIPQAPMPPDVDDLIGGIECETIDLYESLLGPAPEEREP